MNVIRSNPHTHTIFCDGKSTVQEMVDAAIQKGFVSLGFSGHAYQSFDESYPMRKQGMIKYIAAVRKAQAQTDAIRIWLGIEADAYTHINKEDYDYVLGSAHYVKTAEGFCAVDGPRDQVDECVQRDFANDGIAFASNYYGAFVDYIEKERPQIVGHLDLLRKYNAENRYFDESSRAYRKIQEDVCERIAKTGAVVEVNTGGWTRGYFPGFYPNDYGIWCLKELGVPLIVSSDCHDARFLDDHFSDAVCKLKEMGVRSVVRLSGRADTLFEEIEL